MILTAWNDTITIYHKTADRQYSRTVLTGCEWQGITKVVPSERGAIMNNYAELYIRSASPEIETGDFIVLGKCIAEVKTAADLRNLSVEMMTVQGIMDYGSHIEVIGV